MADTAAVKERKPKAKIEHFDVLIAGAGISGVGAAYHLKTQTPKKKFVVLETYESFGGTWLTHTYPGVRSDSDLYTFGYRFKPWRGKPIATAHEIKTYMGEVIEENDLARHIRYRHRIDTATWSSKDNLWTITAVNKATGESRVFTTNFLWMCQGYYDHEKPYIPDWEGLSDYKGMFVHAQLWDPRTDYTGKRVLVIGAGGLGSCRPCGNSASARRRFSGGGGTPFKQAERTCLDLMDSIREEDGRSDFFLGCMNAYGWTPRPGAMLDF